MEPYTQVFKGILDGQLLAMHKHSSMLVSACPSPCIVEHNHFRLYGANAHAMRITPAFGTRKQRLQVSFRFSQQGCVISIDKQVEPQVLGSAQGGANVRAV
jgi:hypothetical protein